MIWNAAAYRGLVLAGVGINLVSLIAFVVLTVLQFDQIRSRLEQERLVVVVERASEPLASAAAIGLRLSSVRGLDALLERARQTDPAILELHLFDVEGNIVVSTQPRDPEFSRAVIARIQSADETEVALREGQDFLSVVRFWDSSGNVAGSLLLEYSGIDARTAVWAMAGRLATAALFFSIVASVLTAWAIRWVLGPEISINNLYVDAATKADQWLWRGRPTIPDSEEPTPIEHAIREADQRYRAVRDTQT
ncbi:hypothetical protein [Limibacillus halophilus]|uniref:Uncharacterized protein n=1 Tax=Limibacillus halophilus TaxID=1579333 RepID=A0A839SQM1_9PROT|nr:hypothetical protein [Limibacillus halophilus]MBB3064538.1 hypothetical protein [Limibacillus halophilus]